MVGIYSHPKEFFIYSSKDKLWVIADDSIYEVNDYAIESFMFSINRQNSMLRTLDSCDNVFGICGAPDMKMTIDIIPIDVNYRIREQTDVTDFYDMEECKKLSKIIQRKFDKILEETKDEEL